VALPSATSPFATPSFNPSSLIRQFRVRATDCVMNTSAYTVGDDTRLSATQNSSASVKYTGKWSRSNVTGTYGGSITSSSATNASAAFTFNGREVAWVASRATNRGVAKVYIDGKLATSVNTYSTTTIRRRVVYTRAWPTAGTHTIKLVCAGTKGHALIDLDAFVVVK
jgi:hypothetical protein